MLGQQGSRSEPCLAEFVVGLIPAGEELVLQLLNHTCCRQSDRLDWMYQGGMVARTEADKRSEEAAQQQLPPLPSGIAVTSDQVGCYVRGSAAAHEQPPLL